MMIFDEEKFNRSAENIDRNLSDLRDSRLQVLPKRQGKAKKLAKPELMPTSFSEFKGQPRIKTILKDTVQAALKRDVPIDHMLFNGLPGQGKTTLAWLVAQEAKRDIITVTASSLDKPMDIYNIFKDVENEKFPIIFIDEIHALKKGLCELFYIPMETPGATIHFPAVYGALNLDIKCPEFTLIGTTAGEMGKLPRPMLDRIQLKLNLDDYTMDDIYNIIEQSAKKLDLSLGESHIKSIAMRSSYIPRKANNLMRVVRNYVISREITRITNEVIQSVFVLLEIDEFGIDRIGRQILFEIAENPGGSIGLKSLASVIGVDESTLVRIYEPELLAMGFIKYRVKGRSVTDKGLQYIEYIRRSNNA
jgi:Holliday junction DNA helicase RuvB